MPKNKRHIEPSKKYKGRGLVLYNAIATSIDTNETIAKRAGYEVNTLYAHFKKADLSDAIMVRYGKAIPYDFSIPYPELAKYFKNIPLFNDVKDDATLTQKLQIIQDKYTELLEKHNMLLEENNELKYQLAELKQKVIKK
ncbi:hypothetical protein M1D52_10635 [Olivibacter sp. SA151]|uniref:hypothetical protein n=1 Tax=Olivibacter jilunii TaxID=985016 RepID=UPI003F159703